MFAVDGQHGHIAVAGCGGENLAGGNHALLVGQAHGLACQMAAWVASRPATPTMAETTKSALGQRGAGNCACRAVNDLNAGDSGGS